MPRSLFCRSALSVILLLGALTNASVVAGSERVALIHTPEAGIQPQAVVDDLGTLHLIYYSGNADGGDVFYVKQNPGASSFSTPLRVNSNPDSAMAVGSIRGAQLAVGRHQRPHVAWDGLGKGAARVPGGKDKTHAPMLYARLNDAGSRFEPERNVINYAFGLDGGGSVAADPKGNVYVTWHGSSLSNTNGEAGRAVYIARSSDVGRTFQAETPATSQPTGACGCCGMKAFADSSGAVYLLYRSASEMVNRSEMLLISPRPNADFVVANAHPWRTGSCPMSSAGLSEGKDGALAAWETTGQVYFASVNGSTQQLSPPQSPAGTGKRKHPIAVSNKRGEILLAWTEGTGWAKGGAVAWQLYDSAGKPTADKGRVEGVPVWGLVTAYAKPDQSFMIIY